jgi:hypothetical protein
MKISGILSIAVLITVPVAGAAADLTGAGGGPFVGPLAIRSTTGVGSAGNDFAPTGVYFGIGGLGYAEFESLRVGGFGIGASSSEDGRQYQSMLGMGGLTLDMLLKPGGRMFMLPLGIMLGAGGYVVKDMSSSTGMMGGNYDWDESDPWDRAVTVYETPFFVIGPRVGFSKEIVPWLRIEGFATFLALFRDDGTSYSFMMTIGPTFGKFDFDRPSPGCEDEYPACAAPPEYPGPPPMYEPAEED